MCNIEANDLMLPIQFINFVVKKPDELPQMQLKFTEKGTSSIIENAGIKIMVHKPRSSFKNFRANNENLHLYIIHNIKINHLLSLYIYINSWNICRLAFSSFNLSRRIDAHFRRSWHAMPCLQSESTKYSPYYKFKPNIVLMELQISWFMNSLWITKPPLATHAW